eukprot:TRINITY_DN730_c0_g1_i8.p1 TRINITY_DN730_c0_g1~~TRINITY_DN730_c0_g1_i8.p1  ORF type:complete len:233 (-),score=32.01 TRINITY_DN730_c0_g1_i8:55-726(-)
MKKTLILIAILFYICTNGQLFYNFQRFENNECEKDFLTQYSRQIGYCGLSDNGFYEKYTCSPGSDITKVVCTDSVCSNCTEQIIATSSQVGNCIGYNGYYALISCDSQVPDLMETKAFYEYNTTDSGSCNDSSPYIVERFALEKCVQVSGNSSMKYTCPDNTAKYFTYYDQYCGVQSNINPTTNGCSNTSNPFKLGKCSDASFINVSVILLFSIIFAVINNII